MWQVSSLQSSTSLIRYRMHLLGPSASTATRTHTLNQGHPCPGRLSYSSEPIMSPSPLRPRNSPRVLACLTACTLSPPGSESSQQSRKYLLCWQSTAATLTRRVKVQPGGASCWWLSTRLTPMRLAGLTVFLWAWELAGETELVLLLVVGRLSALLSGLGVLRKAGAGFMVWKYNKAAFSLWVKCRMMFEIG